MLIPLFSPTIRRSEMDAVLTCMVDEKVGPGEISERLVKKACEYFNVSVAVALRSPAIALNFALQLLDFPKGSGIMLSALAPAWQYVEVLRQGFKPIVLDVNAETALVTPVAIEEGIKQGGRVLVLHYSLGLMPELEPILNLGVPIIEDISEAAGASYNFNSNNLDLQAKVNSENNENYEKKAGTFGVFSILGLEENNILTAGGGAILMAKERRNAIPLKRLYDAAPATDKLPDINAALGFIQLRQIEKNMNTRQEIYDIYIKSLMASRHKTFVLSDKASNPIFSFPVLLSSGFKNVEKYASKKKIEVKPAFLGSIIDIFKEEVDCLHASSLFLRTVLFPLYPRLGAKNSQTIAKVLSTIP